MFAVPVTDPLARMIFAGAGALVFFVGWAMHFVPDHSRAWKYGLVLGGFIGVGVSLWGAAISPAHAGRVALTAVGVSAVEVAVVFWALRPNAPLVEGERSTRWTIRLYRLTTAIQGTDARSLVYLMLWWLFLPIYLALRYAAVARMQRRQILYFRSFGADGASDVFTYLVTAALCRTLPVSELVHAREPAYRIMKDVPLLWRSRFGTAHDDRWRSWVQGRLATCGGAVIDYVPEAPSVGWEIERARAALAPEQIVIIHHEDVVPPSIERVCVIAYSSDVRGDADARRRLSEWAHARAASLMPERMRRAPLRASLRWQLPAVVFIAIAWLIPSLPSAAAIVLRPRTDAARESIDEIFQGTTTYYSDTATRTSTVLPSWPQDPNL